jgi:cbb3-type cytochrome oxidase subunit 3
LPGALPFAPESFAVITFLLVVHTIIAIGLVGVILVLCIVVWHLYTAKEKLQNDHATKLLSLVEKQTEVITKQTLITERVESLLAKTTRLGGKE